MRGLPVALILFLSAIPARADTPARLLVQIPVGASLTINNQPTQQLTATRLFETDPLPEGFQYTYHLKAEYLWFGDPVTLTRTVQVQPGQTTTVEFPTPRGPLIDPPAPVLPVEPKLEFPLNPPVDPKPKRELEPEPKPVPKNPMPVELKPARESAPEPRVWQEPKREPEPKPEAPMPRPKPLPAPPPPASDLKPREPAPSPRRTRS
ncbi:MAG: TIGR03000 domain-containing protein, partial [Gemmataceae bacterium]